MDSATLANIFEPFFTTKEMGNGLGLATVYGIVKQNHGVIHVYSQPGQGSTFTIFLPRYVGAAEMPKTVAAAPIRGHETILLVEDEPAIMDVTRIILEQLGYTVLTAGSPGDAIRLAESRAAGLSMLMTDVIMPEMNGRDLAKTLLARYPRIKCLFMSGYTANVIPLCEQGPDLHFIQKPYTMHDLSRKVRETLDS